MDSMGALSVEFLSNLYSLGTCHKLRDRSLFMTRGERSQMTFFGKYFRGPLDAWRKNFAAYLTSRKIFSMPTLIGRNKHVLNRMNVYIMQTLVHVKG